MTLDLASINWLAAAIGWDEGRQQPQMNPLTYVVPGVLYLVAAVAMAILASATGADTITDGLTLGLVTGIGFALPMVGVEATFDPNKQKPVVWFAITVAYHLIGFVILGVVIAGWP